MGKFYTDKERFEVVKHFLASGLSQTDYSKRHGYARTTIRDWVSAYNHISGDFIRIDNIGTDESIIEGKDIKMNLLRSEEIIKKSTHFTRFDHSIVVIESKGIKVTTSLEQALKILERIHD
jgi:transposase-like protein